MSNRLFWRIAAPFLILTFILALVIYLFLTRTTCLINPGCVLRAMLVAVALGLVGTLVVAWIVAERLVRPVRDVTAVARRAAAGDDSARVLTDRRDELGDMVRAFGELSERRRDQIAVLEKDVRRQATVLDHMADGVLITDDAGQVELINPAACRLLNTTAAGALGRSFAAVARHHALIELWQRCRERGGEQVEAVEISPTLFLQVVATPFSRGDTAGYVIILQDLTQVRRLQVMRRDFISNLSHELRSPLAALRALVETLQEGALDDPAAAGLFLSRAAGEVNTMTQMVEELTELSQIESGQVRLRLAPVAVSALLEGPLARLEPEATAGGLNLRAELPDDLPPVLVDADRVSQVLGNLLHNAIKFTPRGGSVVISAAAEMDEVVVEVRDTGIGIAKADLPRVFERFYKSDRARTRGRGGTGLGLAIARHIVEAHGGLIWVKSKEGKGSSFFFTLPQG